MNQAWIIYKSAEKLRGLNRFLGRLFSRGWLGLLTAKERAALLFLAVIICWGTAGVLIEARRRADLRKEPAEDLYLNLLRALPDMDSLVIWTEPPDRDRDPASDVFRQKPYPPPEGGLSPIVRHLWWRQYYSRLNINTAGVEELVALPGIGPVLARRIMDFREKRGEFFSIRSLMNVRGISRRKYDRIKEHIRAY